MNDQEATTLVERMYAAHGVTKPGPVISELASEMLKSSCHACAKRLVEVCRTDGVKPLTVPMFREGYQREYRSPEHFHHQGQSSRAVDVSKVEAFWRKDAPKVIRPHVADDIHAAHIAARMWYSEAVDPTLEAVAQNLADWTVWLGAEPENVTETQVANLLTFARAVAVAGGASKLSNDEWDRLEALQSVTA